MNWTGTLIFLIGFTSIKSATLDDSDLNPETKVQEESKLNSNLRSALLQVLTDLENEKNEETEMDVEKAHASAITIFANNLNFSRTTEDDSSSKPEAQLLIISNSSTPDQEENIITSATSSFVSESPEPKEETQKKSGFKNLNSISDDEPKKLSKLTTAKEEPFIKTYVKPLGDDVDEEPKFVYVKSPDSPTSTTEAAVEVSTEENEAKVEQVQFFMAPLVAAFTVHQDETGQPNKVEPIYKSESEPVQTQVQPGQSPQSVELRQKQLVLEQELHKLRQQQQDLARNNQFNQFDPIFTEPDRTVVTKLASIDPSDILNAAQQGPLLNKFTANEAIMPLQLNPAPSEVKPINNAGGVSLVPSISFDPLVEAGKLPENAQILPNKEPTGFHNFVALSKQPFNAGFTGNQPNFVQQPVSNFNPQFLGSTTNFINHQPPQRQEPKQSTFSIVPAQQPFLPKHELGVFPPNNRFLRQEPPTNNFLTIPYNNQPPNRILRNQPPRFSIQQSIQPFPPQFSQYLKSNQNNRFLRSNQEGSIGTNQNGFQRPLLQHYKYTSPFGFPGRFH